MAKSVLGATKAFLHGQHNPANRSASPTANGVDLLGSGGLFRVLMLFLPFCEFLYDGLLVTRVLENYKRNAADQSHYTC